MANIDGKTLWDALRDAFRRDAHHATHHGQAVYIQIDDKYYSVAATEIAVTQFDDVWARAVEGKDDAYYVALALDHYGTEIRDNSRTDLIAMGKELDNV